MNATDIRNKRIAIQVHNAQLIDAPVGYEAIVKSSRPKPGAYTEFFGYHFEKKGTYKVGDRIKNIDGTYSTVEAIV
jgi:hypothetical protein